MGDHQLHQSAGLLQDVDGLEVRDIGVERLSIDCQDLVPLMYSAISVTQRILN